MIIKTNCWYCLQEIYELPGFVSGYYKCDTCNIRYCSILWDKSSEENYISMNHMTIKHKGIVLYYFFETGNCYLSINNIKINIDDLNILEMTISDIHSKLNKYLIFS